MAEQNALTELAERLKAKIEHHGYAIESQKQDDIKTQRIITELSKVAPKIKAAKKPNGGIVLMYDTQERMDIINAVYHCLTIAEEGAGKRIDDVEKESGV